jgi:hypothetical protein
MVARTDDKAHTDWLFDQYKQDFLKAVVASSTGKYADKGPEGGYLVTPEMADEAMEKALRSIERLDL